MNFTDCHKYLNKYHVYGFRDMQEPLTDSYMVLWLREEMESHDYILHG